MLLNLNLDTAPRRLGRRSMGKSSVEEKINKKKKTFTCLFLVPLLPYVNFIFFSVEQIAAGPQNYFTSNIRGPSLVSTMEETHM